MSGYNLKDHLEKELEKNSSLLPPWEKYPDAPPWGSMVWRMGSCEGYIDLFHFWIKNLSEHERKKYFENLKLIPEEWLRWSVSYYLNKRYSQIDEQDMERLKK